VPVQVLSSVTSQVSHRPRTGTYGELVQSMPHINTTILLDSMNTYFCILNLVWSNFNVKFSFSHIYCIFRQSGFPRT